MREMILQALIERFKQVVEQTSGMSFAETKVHLPVATFKDYANHIANRLDGT